MYTLSMNQQFYKGFGALASAKPVTPCHGLGGLSMRWPWFNPRPVHVRSVVDSSTGPRFSLSTWVLPSVAFYQHAILIHPFLHLVLALYRMDQEEFAISEENMLLRLVYINITSHAYIRSWTVTQIIKWKKKETQSSCSSTYYYCSVWSHLYTMHVHLWANSQAKASQAIHRPVHVMTKIWKPKDNFY